MENITKIAKLLGEDNEKRLKDEITNLLIYHIEDELSDFDEYLIDYEDLFDEIANEVKTVVKDKYIKMYTEKAEKKFEKLFENQFGE